MRIFTLALTLFLTFPVSASAQTNPLVGGFTAAEKASLLHLRAAMDSTLSLIESECGVVGKETACINVVQGYLDFTQAAGWLFHVNVNPNDAQGAVLLGQARSVVVAEAWFELGRADFELGKSQSTFGSHPDYQNALSEAALVDQTLTYATPYPEGFPKQFGPHGNYKPAQKALWSVVQYGSSAMKGWLNGMLVEELPACPNVFRDYARALRTSQVEAWFMSAHLVEPTSAYAAYQTDFLEALPDDSEAKRALTEIHLVAGRLENESGTTYSLRFVGDSAAACIASTNPNLREFLRRYADSWNNADEWLKYFNGIFP